MTRNSGDSLDLLRSHRTGPPIQFEMALNVLGYQENSKWVALALEMDLRGYGNSWEEAAEDLRDLILMQIDFAFFKGQPEMIWKPAEPVWFGLFADLQAKRKRALMSEPANAEYQIGGIPIPPPHVLAKRHPQFRPSSDGEAT